MDDAGIDAIFWTNPDVEFRPIAGHPGYEISLQGVVRKLGTWELVLKDKDSLQTVTLDESGVPTKLNVIAARDEAYPEFLTPPLT